MSGTSVTWTGNVTRDPEVRFSKAGNAWAVFSIAVDNYNPSAQQGEQNEPTFINVKVLNNALATNVAESIAKGTRVTVSGQIKIEPWTDKDGVKRTSVTLVANDVSVSLKWASVKVAANPRTNNAGAGTPAPTAPVNTSAGAPF